jgi:hypothetical protein
MPLGESTQMHGIGRKITLTGGFQAVQSLCNLRLLMAKR